MLFACVSFVYSWETEIAKVQKYLFNVSLSVRFVSRVVAILLAIVIAIVIGNRHRNRHWHWH